VYPQDSFTAGGRNFRGVPPDYDASEPLVKAEACHVCLKHPQMDWRRCELGRRSAMTQKFISVLERLAAVSYCKVTG
jgi:hypothetical protein